MDLVRRMTPDLSLFVGSNTADGFLSPESLDLFRRRFIKAREKLLRELRTLIEGQLKCFLHQGFQILHVTIVPDA